MIVFLDPGQQRRQRQLDQPPGAHRPRWHQECQASGTSTDDGYPEHTFTWDTVLRIRQSLTALGRAHRDVARQRHRPGPCVDERAEMANCAEAQRRRQHPRRRRPADRARLPRQLLVAAAQPGAGRPVGQFAQIMRDQLQASGLVPATYIGSGGLYPRAD
jgi:N-acetylmuramoyl-L-alanine amidase